MAYTTIDNPEEYFKCVQWTGNSTEPRNIDVGFQTDLNWMKDCSIGYHYRVFDSSRTTSGYGKALYLNVDAVEDNYNDHPEIDYGNSPYSNGFEIVDNQTSGGTTGSVGVNLNNSIMTSWNWKCNGGTTSTNTDGDINSTVQVNQDAGLSIVTYSPSNTTARNIGHGLGGTPDFIAIRNRTRAETWRTSWGVKNWGGLAWNEEYPYNTTSTALCTGASSTTFGVGTDWSVNGNYDYIAYVWKAIPGFSKFGDYYGNGQTSSGTFVHTGFKPAMVIVKSVETGTSNMLFDNVRDATNIVKSRLKTNATDVPATNINIMDFRSNGFQLRVNDSSFNTNTHQYMYFAFAESPFVSSTGTPTTAR
tara:strand:- start:276 stop:1358 length:1083 start_codon:yes stop_codon:yes gene_type:complete